MSPNVKTVNVRCAVQSDATSSTDSSHSQQKLLLLDVPCNVCIHSLFMLYFYPGEVRILSRTEEIIC